MALATFVGQNLGAKQYDRVKKGTRFGMVCCMLMSWVVSGIIFGFAPQLISLFNSDPQVVAYGVMQSRTVSLFYFLMAFSHGIAGTLRGAGRSIVPMIVMMMCWCLIRVSYIVLVARASDNIRMIFWAYPITWSLSSITFLIYYLKADWPHYLDQREKRQEAKA